MMAAKVMFSDRRGRDLESKNLQAKNSVG